MCNYGILTWVTNDFFLRPLRSPLSFRPLQIRSFHLSPSVWGEVKVIECPAFAESISEGDLRWEKQEGEQVEQDEVICEVETDKTSVPVPSPVAGVLRKQLVEDGATVSPGTKIAEVEAGAEGTAAAPKAEEVAKQAVAAATAAGSSAEC